MAEVQSSRVWTRQPVGRALIAENYKRDLLFAYTPWDGVLSADGQRKSYSGTMPSLAAGKAGVVGSFSSTNAQFISISNTGGLSFGNGISVVIVAKRNQVTVTNGAFFGRGSTGAGRINISFTSTTISQLCTDATSTSFGPTKSYVNGTDDTTPAIVTTVNDYYVIATKFPAVPGNGQLLAVGRWGGTSYYGNVNIALCAMWPRQLSDAELQSLSLNPWQLFAPQRQVSYFFPTTTTVTPVVSRRIWTRQPQGLVQINWNNPLTRGLVSSLELTRNSMRDYASSLTFNHTVPIVGTQVGQAPSFAGAGISTGVTSIGGQNLFATATNPFTISVLARRTAQGTFVARAGATTGNRTFQIAEYQGLNVGATPAVYLRGVENLTGLGIVDTNWHLYTVAYNGSSATLWVDANQSAALTIGTAAEETSELITIGSRTGTSGFPLTGNVAFVRIWSRALSRSEHQALYENPWQLFAPQRRVSYFLPSTGITPLVSRRIRTRQPGPTAEINWANPLTRGLISALSPWMDHARRIPISRVGAPEQTVRQYGLSVKGTNAGLVSVPVSNLGAELSVLSVGFWTSVAGSGSNLGLSSTAGNAIFGVSSEVTTSNNRWALRQTNSGSFVGRNYGTNQNTSGVNVVLCGVFTNGNDIDVYWNGRLDKGTFSNGSTSSSGSNTIFDRFSIGGVNTSPVNYAKVGVDTTLGLLYNRALTASEIAEISANPWQLFAPQQQVTYFGTSGGGTVYNLSISETSLTSDSISSIVTWFASLSETATVSDSPSTTVIFPTAISETATVSDSPSAAAVFPTAIDETATVSDSPTTTVIFPTAISETVTVSDSPTTTVIFPTAISETATGSDATASSFALSSAVSETATGNDITDSAFALASAVSETATASETNTSSLIVYPSVSETATASESVTTVLIIYPSISETVGAADTITTIATLNVGVTETVTATDIVTGATTMTVTLSETATASDSVIGADVIGTAIAETATASESVDSSLVYLGNIDETVTASESISTIATQNVEVLETASAADSLTIGGSYQVSLSETVVAADAVTSRFLWEPIDTSQTPGWSNISTTQNANWSSITTTQTANWQPVNTGS